MLFFKLCTQTNGHRYNIFYHSTSGAEGNKGVFSKIYFAYCWLLDSNCSKDFSNFVYITELHKVPGTEAPGEGNESTFPSNDEEDDSNESKKLAF